jgi:hypothetical protein
MLRDRAILVAFAFSLFFHLSMITLFKIVVVFPEERLHYFPVEIVNPLQLAGRFVPSQSESVSSRIAMPSLSDPFQNGAERQDTDSSDSAAIAGINLPKLSFAELERLEARDAGLRLKTEYDGPTETRQLDSWARFGEEIEGLRGVILGVLDRLQGEAASVPLEPAPRIEVHPAPGFSGYIEWNDEPKARGLIYAAPVPELWGKDPAAFALPVTIGFRVNSDGKVTEVLPPLGDDSLVVEAVSNELLHYRFEPGTSSEKQDQHGTLFLAAEVGTEP